MCVFLCNLSCVNSNHHQHIIVKITEQFHYRNPLGYPFTGTPISCPDQHLFNMTFKEKDLIIYSIICHIESFSPHFSRVIKEQDISRVWMSYSYAAVQCKVDKEIFNYGHRIFQIRDSVFPNPSHTQALSISSPWTTAGLSAGRCYHHWDRQWRDLCSGSQHLLPLDHCRAECWLLLSPLGSSVAGSCLPWSSSATL